MIKYILYTHQNESNLDLYLNLLQKISKKHSIKYELHTFNTLSLKEKEILIENLRVISRKNAIGIVSKGTGPLIISRSKQIGKNSILLVIENKQIKDVYPHEKNKKRTDIKSYLNIVLKSNSIDDIINHNNLTESDIARMLSTFPELIEKDLQFIDTEIEVEGGRIDIAFLTKNKKHLLIEIEIEAKDNAIGQVQRFVTYADKYNISKNNIRLGIVCGKISKSRLNACINAGIEVYTLCLNKNHI